MREVLLKLTPIFSVLVHAPGDPTLKLFISNAATSLQPRKTLFGKVPVKSSNSAKNDQNISLFP